MRRNAVASGHSVVTQHGCRYASQRVAVASVSCNPGFDWQLSVGVGWVVVGRVSCFPIAPGRREDASRQVTVSGPPSHADVSRCRTAPVS